MAMNPALDALQNYPNWRVPQKSWAAPDQDWTEADAENLTMQPGLGPGAPMQPRDPSMALASLARAPIAGLGRVADPLAGQAQEVEGIRSKQLASKLAGFNSPEEQSMYNRQQEENRVNMPLQVERERQRGAMEMAQEASRRALDLQEAKSQGGYEAVQNVLQGGGLQPGSRVSIPGVGSFSTPKETQVPTSISTELAKARAKAQPSWGGWGSVDTEAKAKLDSLVATALQQHPQRDQIMAFVQAAKANPKLANYTTEELIQAKGETDLTPDEILLIKDLRGK